MIITKTNDTIIVKGNDYAIEASESKISVMMGGESVVRLQPVTAIDVTQDDDESCYTDVESESVKFSFIEGNPSVFKWESSSSLWEKKEYVLECYNDRAEYSVTVHGKGRVDSVCYFLRYNEKGKKRGGQFDFSRGFYPNIYESGDDGFYYMGAPRDVDSTLTVPPMFFHAYNVAGMSRMLMFALVAQMGEHNFTKFSYFPEMYFRTDHDGHTYADGSWTAPKIVICTAEDQYDACERYASLYFDTGICPRGVRGDKPRFWHGPIACGWFEQLAQAYEFNGKLMEMSKEETYLRMLERFGKRGISPKILIIDDQWMEEYGPCYAHPERWPDLRRFIDERRAEGVHVFLWYRLWISEGFPEELGHDSNHDDERFIDPTDPAGRETLRQVIRRLISSEEGCYNADGIKIDFAFMQPRGRKMRTYSGKYGAELLYEYIKLIHDTAKECKPHAVINASPAHPIFAAIVDHARLHDYESVNVRCAEEFRHRAKIWGYALPDSLIDMDGGITSTNRDVMRFLLSQAKHGIPDLYFISDFPNFVLTDEEWERVADAWRQYNKKCDILYGEDTIK